MTSSKWASVAPADMTDEQLKEASKSAALELARCQAATNDVQLVNWHLHNEVVERFGLPVPGLPQVTQIPEYPTEFAAEHKWPSAAELKREQQSASDDQQ